MTKFIEGEQIPTIDGGEGVEGGGREGGNGNSSLDFDVVIPQKIVSTDCATYAKANDILGTNHIPDMGVNECVTVDDLIGLGADPFYTDKYIDGNEMVNVNDVYPLDNPALILESMSAGSGTVELYLPTEIYLDATNTINISINRNLQAKFILNFNKEIYKVVYKKVETSLNISNLVITGGNYTVAFNLIGYLSADILYDDLELIVNNNIYNIRLTYLRK